MKRIVSILAVLVLLCSTAALAAAPSLSADLPKKVDYGTKERIKKRYGEDISITAYIKRLIENDLNGSAAVVSEQEVKRVPRRVSEQMPEQIPERVQEQTSQRVAEQVQEQTETRRRQPEGLPSFML